ncbi:hypothetical protein SB748_31440, partial [Rhizobium sp. SIMBA_035]
AVAGIPLRGIFRPRAKVTLSDALQVEPGRRSNLAATVTIRAGLSPVSPAFSKSFGDTRSLTPQGFSADSGVYLQISNSFCSERAGVDRLRRP